MIGRETGTGRLLFCDCAAETPAGRRSLCYDDEALRKRKKNPKNKRRQKKPKQNPKRNEQRIGYFKSLR